MNIEMENVKQAKESFDRILDNKKYADIIRDDKHLSVLLDLIDDNNYRKILDIGTGTGYLAFPLAKEHPTANIYGIDIAETIIEKNNDSVKEKGIQNLIFQAFDGLTYPFDDESFDLIVTRYAFHHFPNVNDAVRQMNKLLIKGGRVLVSDPVRSEHDSNGIIDSFMKVKKDGHIQFYTFEELDEFFTNNGFSKEKQVITDMKFPFAKRDEYIDVYNKLTDDEIKLYDITNENGIVWIKHIDVGNTVFVKRDGL